VLEVEVQAAGNNAKVTIDRNTGLAPQEIDHSRLRFANCRSARNDQVRYQLSLPLPDDPRKWQGWIIIVANYYERLCLDPHANPSNGDRRTLPASSCGGGKKNCRSRISR